MKLQVGDKAIYFEVTDYTDNIISLKNYSDKIILLSFFRYASCPLCKLRLHNLIEKYPEYQKNGMQIIAFFESPKESTLKYLGNQKAPFPIIPDPKRIIYKSYKIEKSFLKYIKGVFSLTLLKAMFKGFLPGKIEGIKTLVPADFIIENMVIKKIYYGKDISDHMPIKIIDEYLGII